MAQELTYETVYSAISTVRELIADKWVKTPEPNTFLMPTSKRGTSNGKRSGRPSKQPRN